jgi:hypothetical protein
MKIASFLALTGMASVKFPSAANSVCFAHTFSTRFESIRLPVKFCRLEKKNVSPLMQQMPRQLFLAISVFSLTRILYVTPSFGDNEKKKDLDLPIFKTSDSGLKYLDIKQGSGPEAKNGCKVTFHYIGRLAGRQGKIYEDTYADEPYRITLGTDKIIPGLQEGLLGMKEGGKRRLLIPSSLAYSDMYAVDVLDFKLITYSAF